MKLSGGNFRGIEGIVRGRGILHGGGGYPRITRKNQKLNKKNKFFQ